MSQSALIADFIERFDQYGNQAAKWWLIGSEEAGVTDLNDFYTRLQVWDALGRPAVADVADFHNRLGITHLFQGTHVKVQSTWRRLIQLMIAARSGVQASDQDIHDYQRDCLARQNGQEWLTELHPLPAKNEKHWIYAPLASLPGLQFLQSRRSYLKHSGPKKIARLQSLIANTPRHDKPLVVICYGSHADAWQAIAGMPVHTPMRSGAHYARLEKSNTIVVVTQHPQARAAHKAYWTETGLELHSLL